MKTQTISASRAGAGGSVTVNDTGIGATLAASADSKRAYVIADVGIVVVYLSTGQFVIHPFV